MGSLEVIGKAAKHKPDGFREKRSYIEWRDLVLWCCLCRISVCRHDWARTRHKRPPSCVSTSSFAGLPSSPMHGMMPP